MILYPKILTTFVFMGVGGCKNVRREYIVSFLFFALIILLVSDKVHGPHSG